MAPPAVRDAQLATVINGIALSECHDLAIHAGVVERGGNAVAFPAASGSGKSVLSMACVQSGASYVSDEALVLRRSDGTVRPYAKPVNLAWSGLSALGHDHPPFEGKHPFSSHLFGRTSRRSHMNLRYIVLMARRPGAAEIEAVPEAEAAEQMLRLSFNHFVEPRSSMALVAERVRRAGCFRLAYETPEDGARQILSLLDL
jgi:hypothetical protein